MKLFIPTACIILSLFTLSAQAHDRVQERHHAHRHDRHYSIHSIFRPLVILPYTFHRAIPHYHERRYDHRDDRHHNHHRDRRGRHDDNRHDDRRHRH